MNKVLPVIALLLVGTVLGGAGPTLGPVLLRTQPGTPLDATARTLVADDLAEARRAKDRPLLLVGQAQLGPATDRPALFVQLQSARECGSAGCSTAVFAWSGGAYTRVLDGLSGPVMTGPGRHRGMADLTTEHERYVWDGQNYVDTRPAPALNLRPRPHTAPHPITPRR